jgi:cytochrome c oxidase subunit II
MCPVLGLQHAMMLLRISVDTRDDFAAWVLNQQQPGVQDAKVAAGRYVFETQACINYHSIIPGPEDSGRI